MTEDMTLALWEMLPEQYKVADSVQEPNPYPLRRWLDGPGSIMTQVRYYADMAESGGLTTINTTNLIADPVDDGTLSLANFRFTSDSKYLVNDGGYPAVEMIQTNEADALYFDTRDNWDVRNGLAVGKWIAFSAEVKLIGGWKPLTRVNTVGVYGGAAITGSQHITVDLNDEEYRRAITVSKVAALPAGGYLRTLVYPSPSPAAGVGFRARRLMAAVGDTREEAISRVSEWTGTPKKMLPWLARMLGIDPRPNTLAETRQAILSRASGSAPYIGTRKHIGDAAARVLGSDAPLGVFPHPTDPWVIIVASDVQSIADAGGLDVVWTKLSRLSVAPAGFYIMPMEARVTWDQFDTAKPPTWEVFDQKLQTWNQVDSVGVVFG